MVRKQAALTVARVAVVLLWLALVAVLLRGRDEAAAPVAAVPPAPPATAAGPAGTWMGVYMHDHKIGYTYSQFSPAGLGYRFEQRSLLRLTVMDTVETVRAEVHGETGGDFALRSFTASIRSGVGNLEAHGQVEGNELAVTLHTGTEESRQRIPLREPIYLPMAARQYLRRGELAAGKDLTVMVFDPTTLQHQPMRVTIERRENAKAPHGDIPAWRIREELHGMQTIVWLDDAGDEVREEGPLELVAVRETAADAVASGWRGDAAFDVMAAVKVPLRGTIAAPREATRLDLRLGGIPEARIPEDARQHQEGDRLIIRREDADAIDTYPLPYDAEEWRTALAPTTFLQVDHPRIRDAANKALAGETDARPAADRLRRWVTGYLEKVPVASVPNALQVLDMRRGDCNEHAVLFAALARAAGLPARVVGGVVYANDGFLYHAWNEVWLGTAWVSVDPTFDQMPADATHIKLVESAEETDALMRVIGRLTIDVLETG